MTTDDLTEDAQQKYIPDVRVANITTHPDNPRHDVGNVDDLALSIKHNGVLEPLVVVPPRLVPGMDEDPGIYSVLIAGHRRLSAAALADVATVPVIVRYDLDTRDKQIAAMVIENQHRSDLSPVEEGEAYQLLLDITPRSTQAKVAKAVGMPRTSVSERVRLTHLDDTAKTAVHNGQITLTDALELLTIEEKYPELAAKATEVAGTQDFAFRLKRARADAESLDKYAAVRAHAHLIGTPILDKAPGYESNAPRRVTQHAHGLDLNTDQTVYPSDTRIGDAHADCPGAAAWIPKTAGDMYTLGWYCTAYADHHYPTKEERQAEADADRQQREQAEQDRVAALTPEERAAEEQERAEKEARREARQDLMRNLEAARAARAQHLAEVIQKGDEDLAEWALHDLTTGALAEYGNTHLTNSVFALALLGIPAHDDCTTGRGDLDEVHARVKKLNLAQTVLYLWAQAAEVLDDEMLLFPWNIDTPRDLLPDERYVAALTDKFGYQWSTFETEQFDLDAHGHVRTDDEADDEAGAA